MVYLTAAALAASGVSLIWLLTALYRLTCSNDRHLAVASLEVAPAASALTLAGVGRHLQTSVDRLALAARYGGDEFCVVIRDASLDQVIQLATGLLDGLARIPAPQVITASAGVSWGKTGSQPPQTFLSAADQALYEAKAAGGGQARVHALAPATEG